MVIKNITHDIMTNLNITPILFIIFRYHTVDNLLKMSDILKIEYYLSLTLTALPPLPMPCCCQACCHCPQGCSHAAALAAGAPTAAAVLAPCCPLRFLRCRPHHHAVAAALLPPPYFCHHHTSAATALLPPLH